MEVLEVGAAEFAGVVQAPYHVFGSAAFNDLNKNRAEEVFFLLFREGKFRLGLVGGRREQVFYSPYSAPFGGFSYVSENIRIQYIEAAVRSFVDWAKKQHFSSVSMTLPPPIYNVSFNAKQVNCLWRLGFKLAQTDLNYSFDLEGFDDRYIENIWYNARKNLKIALGAGLQFRTCTHSDDRQLAYEIIRKNRESRGFPLRMSWQQVEETTALIPADFFMVNEASGNPIASAIVFHVAPDMVQVIYWGDLHEYGKLKTMNFLSYSVFKHYSSLGITTVDLGTSTEDSVPNYGLAEFKEGIGCSVDPKFTFTRILD
jgi:hypothetical protein